MSAGDGVEDPGLTNPGVCFEEVTFNNYNEESTQEKLKQPNETPQDTKMMFPQSDKLVTPIVQEANASALQRNVENVKVSSNFGTLSPSDLSPILEKLRPPTAVSRVIEVAGDFVKNTPPLQIVFILAMIIGLVLALAYMFATTGFAVGVVVGALSVLSLKFSSSQQNFKASDQEVIEIIQKLVEANNERNIHILNESREQLGVVGTMTRVIADHNLKQTELQLKADERKRDTEQNEATRKYNANVEHTKLMNDRAANKNQFDLNKCEIESNKNIAIEKLKSKMLGGANFGNENQNFRERLHCSKEANGNTEESDSD